jgi:hypothetical protein
VNKSIPDRELVHRVRDALLAGIDRLEANRHGSQRSLWRSALELEHLILSDLLTPDEQSEVLTGMDAGRRDLCGEIFCALETLIENSFAAMALGGHEDVILREDSISENYLNRYEELARKEVALAGIASGDRVLFIGSGPLPITAIEYCRQTGCTADCVDFQPEAVNTSRIVIERLGLSSRIQCRQARGEHVPASGYSVVLVGVLARPKQEIIDNLEATCPEGCRILTRTTFGLRRLIYQPAEFDRLARLHRMGTNEARGDQILSADLWR